jgi:K+-sensing histidine kinase KdpD
VLVLVLVGVAANGHRPAGLLAAVSAAVSFDFFWTQPYETLAITTRADIETAVLLLLVGLAHPELLELLAAAEKLLAATGDAVTLCPTHGGEQTR